MTKEGQAAAGEWIPYARQSIATEDIQAVVETLQSDFITQGPRLAYFEDGLREATGARYAVAVSSGTAALHLAYRGLGLGKGDAGIVPAITFAATANALRYCCADVGWCDVDEASGLADLCHFARATEDLAEQGMAPKLLAPVSFSGSMPDLASISEYAQRKGMHVVEDAAHSLGAFRAGVGSGSCAYSDAAILSFHPVKHICAGEGGAVLSNDETLARRVRSLRTHGIEKTAELCESEGGWSYAQEELGWNYRMTDLQASLGASQLRRLGDFIRRRRQIARRYHEAFQGDVFSTLFERPQWDEGSSWHLYVIRFREKAMRRAAYDWLREKGIGTQVHYMPAYRHPYYHSDADFSLPGAEAFYSGCLSIPMYPDLGDDKQKRVIEVLEGFCRSSAK